MTDQSGAFPETLREAAQRILDRVGDYYDNEPPSCGVGCSQCCDTSLTVGDLRALRAALERPRPAPPEPSAEAFEAAAKVLRKEFDARSNVPAQARYIAWDQIREDTRQLWRDGVRNPLLAAYAVDFGGPAGTGAAPPDAQAGVELVESSRLPQGIEAAKTGSAVDSAKSPTNSPSYALFDLFSRGAPRPFVGVDQKPDGCWFACIASLTGIPLDDFPDPPTKDTESDVRNVVTKLLHAHGWQLHRLYTIPDAVPRGWAIAGGTSPRNLAHAVVMYDGELVWDPHPSRAGLAAIEEYEVLVPVRAGNALPVRGGAAQPPPSAPIRELAEAAQGYLNSQEMVGSTEEMRRALRQRLGQLIGPHLVAQCAGVPREETNHE